MVTGGETATRQPVTAGVYAATIEKRTTRRIFDETMTISSVTVYRPGLSRQVTEHSMVAAQCALSMPQWLKAGVPHQRHRDREDPVAQERQAMRRELRRPGRGW